MKTTGFKFWDGRLTKRDRYFKSLVNGVEQRTFTNKDALGLKAFILETRPVETMSERLAATGLFDKYFESSFKGQAGSNKIIINSFESTMHTDSSWDSNLFLTVVLKGCKEGHILFAENRDVDNNKKFGKKFLNLKQGDVFLLDPLSIHSVHCRAKEKKDLVLLQYEMSYASRKQAVSVMESLDWLTETYTG